MKRSLTKSIISKFQVMILSEMIVQFATGLRGGVAFLVKHGLVVNKEYRNEDFNIITENEALAINLDLSNNQNITLTTIYCPNRNPNLPLFQTINNLSEKVMFVGDFNSKLESFGCAKRNTSGPMLHNIQNQLNLIYLNNDEHTHMDRAKGSTDILDMAFISPNLAKHDIQFQIGDDLGSDHLPIEISIDTSPNIGIHLPTTPSTNLTRLTEQYSNQHSMKC